MKIELDIPDLIATRLARILGVSDNSEDLRLGIMRTLRQLIWGKEQDTWVKREHKLAEDEFKTRMEQEAEKRRQELGI